MSRLNLQEMLDLANKVADESVAKLEPIEHTEDLCFTYINLVKILTARLLAGLSEEDAENLMEDLAWDLIPLSKLLREEHQKKVKSHKD